jgi:hypothetical protein
MNRIALGAVSLLLFVTASFAQSAPATDVYHVHFVKAALGQAKALEAELTTPDPKDPTAAHMLVLKHQDGDDWDYVVIKHLGKTFTIDPANYAALATPKPGATPTMAWHTDTITSGPGWEEFSKEMGGEGAVYVVATWRAATGHRQELAKVLNARDANAKVQTGNVTLTHMEGGPWQYFTIQHYKSWQDFAADEAASQDAQGWYDIRDHGAWHHDTLTTRVGAATK